MIDIHLSPRRIVRLLNLVVLLLTVAGVGAQIAGPLMGPAFYERFYEVIRRFDLDLEMTVPNWYQSSMLLVCAVLLATIACVRSTVRGRYVKHWWALAFCFLLLSIDEAAAIHDLAAIPLEAALSDSGLLKVDWVLVGAPLAVLVGVTFWRFLWDLPPPTRWRFVLAGSVYVAAVVGLEGLENWYGDDATVTYAVMTTVEEVLEMVSIVVFFEALLSYLLLDAGALRISLSKSAEVERE